MTADEIRAIEVTPSSVVELLLRELTAQAAEISYRLEQLTATGGGIDVSVVDDRGENIHQSED